MSCVSLENFRKFKSFHCIKMTWGGESAIFGVLNRGQNGSIGCHKGHWNLQKSNCCHPWRKNKCNMWWMMAAYLIDAYMFYWCRSIFFQCFWCTCSRKNPRKFIVCHKLDGLLKPSDVGRFKPRRLCRTISYSAYAAPFHMALLQHPFTWRLYSTFKLD